MPESGFLFGLIKGADHNEGRGMPCMECHSLIIEAVWYDSQDGGPINIVCRDCAERLFREAGLAHELKRLQW